MTTTQADLFLPRANAVPQEKTWYPVRFVGREVITSPTQGQMYRLKAKVIDCSLEGLVVWKPLTTANLKGIEWCERTLRACGWKTYHLSRLRSRTGIGKYLEGLVESVTALTSVEATIYLYHHATEGGFWTIRTVRRC